MPPFLSLSLSLPLSMFLSLSLFLINMIRWYPTQQETRNALQELMLSTNLTTKLLKVATMIVSKCNMFLKEVHINDLCNAKRKAHLDLPKWVVASTQVFSPKNELKFCCFFQNTFCFVVLIHILLQGWCFLTFVFERYSKCSSTFKSMVAKCLTFR